jgi:hypothetical protein
VGVTTSHLATPLQMEIATVIGSTSTDPPKAAERVQFARPSKFQLWKWQAKDRLRREAMLIRNNGREGENSLRHYSTHKQTRRIVNYNFWDSHNYLCCKENYACNFMIFSILDNKDSDR